MLHVQSYTAKSHIWLAGKQLCLWSRSASTMLAPTVSLERFASSNMKKYQTYKVQRAFYNWVVLVCIRDGGNCIQTWAGEKTGLGCSQEWPAFVSNTVWYLGAVLAPRMVSSLLQLELHAGAWQMTNIFHFRLFTHCSSQSEKDKERERKREDQAGRVSLLPTVLGRRLEEISSWARNRASAHSWWDVLVTVQ